MKSHEPPNQISTHRRAPSVRIAFRTLGRTLRHGYENIGTLAIVSLLWIVGALLILPLGAVTAALHRVTRPMSEERSASWRHFFDHLRADLRWSSLLTLVLLGGFYLIQINIGFYGAAAPPLSYVAILFLTLLIIWSGMALYAFPLALRQDEQRLRTTLRNALVMVFSNAPGTLISLLLLLALSILLLVLPPLFVIVPGVVALWGQENARMLLVAGGYIPEDEIADRPRIK